MTEATAMTSGGGLPPAPPNHDVISVTRYEAGPPEGVSQNELVQGGVPVGEDGETFSTTKEEEWVTKKKTELTTTRQIETRVKRQVVLEDGKVVEDSGPIVTTNTTEDTEKQEHQQTEHRKLGDDPSATAIKEGDGDEAKNWVAVSSVPMEGIVKEVNERRVLSREETQETCETEDIQHLGDITDEAYLAAVASGQEDIREPLRESLEKDRMIISSTGPRIVHQSSKTHKTIDTEDTHETKAVNPDGFLVTETKRTTEHEEIKDEDLSDNGAESVDECNESSQRHRKTKDQEFVEYVADGVPIGREMRYQAETTEGERHGAATGDQEWESLSARLRKNKRHHLHRQRGLDCPTEQIGPPLDRKDALTKRPIDFDQEEETRKEETSKWLEHHFGSDSRSSKGSIDEEVGTKESYFNVTIKSQPKVAPVVDPIIPKSYVATVNSTAKVFSPSPEPINGSKYYQGVSEWSERRYESRSRSPKEIHRSERVRNYAQHSNSMEHLDRVDRQFIEYSDRRSPYGDVPERDTTSFKPIHTESRNYRTAKIEREVYEGHRSPYHKREDGAPTPPQRKRAMERKQRSSDDSRYDSGYRSHSRNEMSYQSRDSKEDILPIEEPPPDYSPPPRVTPSPSPPYHQRTDKKLYRDRRSPSPPYEDKKGYHRSKTTPSPSEISSMREKREYNTDSLSKDRRRNGVSPSPSPPVKDKKLYQRTRFAADIPPPKQNASRQSSGSGSGGGGIIGQSIRKLVGKIRSASAERKAKQKAKRLSRSPSPHNNRHQSRSSPTYQQFNVIDNNIPSTPGSRVGRHSELGVSSADNKQVSSASLTQRNVSSRASDHIASENAMHHQRRTSSPVQRYYLGEDPFGGSIYGRENKYDGVRPVRSSRKLNGVKVNGHSTGFRRGNNTFEDDVNRTHSSTLGRFSKSTSRLLTNGDTVDYSRSVQTLPRNIHHTEKVRHQSSVNHSPPTRLSNNSSSHINVSIINTVSPPSSNIGINRPLINGGPAKPARTYKSSLSRSKSFNVHAGDLDQHREVVSSLNSSSRNMSNVYKSNPHLNRLDENPIGLKSPGIVSSIYRSQKDLNGAIIEEERKENVYTSRYVKNGTDEKKNVFLKGLADRAPELYKTLHGNDEENAHKKTVTSTFNHTPFKNTSNFRSSPENNLNSTLKHSTENNFTSSRFENSFNNSPRKYENSPLQTVVRRGSNGSDNYSETYHITSKSDDPSRPSVTDTVQSFSKKTIPSKDGRKLETIESTETKTVTKSRYRGEPVSNLKYLENGGKFNGGGVVIELRNNNYRK